MAESSSRIQLTDVKETITCGICLQIFTDPRGLTCGHTYCLVCLKGFQGTSSVKECPICRAKTIPKSSELEKLPVNKLAGDLVKLVHQYEPATIEAPPQWKAPEVREKRPAARLSGLRGDFLNFALSGGRADLGMLSAALTGLQTDLQEHLLEEVRPVQESEESDQNSSRPQHTSITCDECRSSSIRGDRYKCGICDDYDLCEKCQKIVRGAVHDPEHLLIKLKRPATTNPRELCAVLKEDAILIGMSYNETATQHKRETDEGESVDIICSHCGRGPISGVRYMCGYCVDYNLCSDCEKNSEEIHDNKHLFLVIDHPTQYHPTQAQLTHNFYGAIQDTEGQSQEECAAAAAAAPSQSEHGPITDITTLKMQSSESTESTE